MFPSLQNQVCDWFMTYYVAHKLDSGMINRMTDDYNDRWIDVMMNSDMYCLFGNRASLPHESAI